MRFLTSTVFLKQAIARDASRWRACDYVQEDGDVAIPAKLIT
jgi:hypothetical protein